MRQYRDRMIYCKSTNPVIVTLFKEMRRQRISILDLADRSGVSKQTISFWKYNRIANPLAANLEACYNVLGFTLKPTRIREKEEINV